MLFTVCTPTYNRAHTLSRVFESLKAQSLTDFEWIIIDDGSSDNTADLVQSWMSQSPFPVRYEFQVNQGKHIAVNHGVHLARGTLFAIADSDDILLPNALQTFMEYWNDIPDELRSSFTGVTGLCVSEAGEIVGDSFPEAVFDSTPMEVNYRERVTGEKWGFHRTDVLRLFPFPEFTELPYFAEGIIWHSIGRQFKTRFINEPVRIYQQDAGDQLTHRNPIDNSPARLFYVQSLNADYDYMLVAPWKFTKMAIQGVRYSLHQDESLKVQIRRLERLRIKLLWMVASPAGLILYLRDIFIFSSQGKG